MGFGAWPDQAISLLLVVERELLVFTAFWLIVGGIDELGVDLFWLALRLTGRARTRRLPVGADAAPLGGRMAVFIAAWHEAGVIGATIRHAGQAWRQADFTLFVGCYRNDGDTIRAAVEAAGADPRIRIVIHDNAGPTTKADCLNRLYRALEADENRRGLSYRGVVLHDAEDMVHAAELAVFDEGLRTADFVQLPVRPEPQPASHWIAGHYTDEFTEAHAKGLVVRDALGAAIPSAGVGCAVSRAMLGRIARLRMAEGGAGPFDQDCLTEDYELGVLIWREGGRCRFVRLRDAAGSLVATRAYFPARLDASVRQKTRWIHGIAFQSWDRLGWAGNLAELWMALRDRRGPLTAIVLFFAYILVLLESLRIAAPLAGLALPPLSPLVRLTMTIGLAGFAWRGAWRFVFTAREYGPVEGIRAVLRVPVANFIAIMAGRRAMVAYLRTLAGGTVRWDKTTHDAHPALAASGGGR